MPVGKDEMRGFHSPQALASVISSWMEASAELEITANKR